MARHESEIKKYAKELVLKGITGIDFLSEMAVKFPEKKNDGWFWQVIGAWEERIYKRIKRHSCLDCKNNTRLDKGLRVDCRLKGKIYQINNRCEVFNA